MKKILLSLAFVATPLVAHEGHNHGNNQAAPAQADFADHSAHLVFEGHGLHAHASWKQPTAQYEQAILRLEFRNADTHEIVEPNAPVSVDIWHPLFGLGVNQIFVNPAKNADGTLIPGTYDASNVYFLRGGNWEVRVGLGNLDGTEETQNFVQGIVPVEEDPWLDPNDPIHSMHDMSKMMEGMNHSSHGAAKNKNKPAANAAGTSSESDAQGDHGGH